MSSSAFVLTQFCFLFWRFVCLAQAIINSTITPNMTFTKTSHKFGQWADSRANTVYGLGFSSESHLSKVRTAARTRDILMNI